MSTTNKNALLEAIARATAIYEKNTENIRAFAIEQEKLSGYIEARKEVERLYAEYNATKIFE
ncbi:MAG: hypothetical protein EBR82_87960 [Caulobacteraceae bacterium]|nr:hypothetical protein [Caulobacteraceae bacterium]